MKPDKHIPHGFAVINPTQYIILQINKLTKWQKICCWFNENVWEPFVFASMVAGAVACFQLAIYFMFGGWK